MVCLKPKLSDVYRLIFFSVWPKSIFACGRARSAPPLPRPDPLRHRWIRMHARRSSGHIRTWRERGEPDPLVLRLPPTAFSPGGGGGASRQPAQVSPASLPPGCGGEAEEHPAAPATIAPTQRWSRKWERRREK